MKYWVLRSFWVVALVAGMATGFAEERVLYKSYSAQTTDSFVIVGSGPGAYKVNRVLASIEAEGASLILGQVVVSGATTGVIQPVMQVRCATPATVIDIKPNLAVAYTSGDTAGVYSSDACNSNKGVLSNSIGKDDNLTNVWTQSATAAPAKVGDLILWLKLDSSGPATGGVNLWIESSNL